MNKRERAMWTYNYTDELYHYGVLGMKWGVRRYQAYSGAGDWRDTVSPNASRRTKRRAKKADIIRQKKDYTEAKALRSDKSTKRLNKKYSRLEKKEQKAIDALVKSDNTDRYKQANKKINKQKAANYRDYVKTSLKPWKDLATGKVKKIPGDLDASRQKEINMAVGMYVLNKQQKANKLTYLSNIGKQNSVRYKMGKRSLNSNVERFGNYTVRRLPNGSYNITKTVYY